jgi:hypothetical protein
VLAGRSAPSTDVADVTGITLGNPALAGTAATLELLAASKRIL